MDRKDFIKKLGGSAAFVLLFPCTQGCSNEDLPSFPSEEESEEGIDLSIDLSLSENADLQVNGGYIRRNNVVIARNLEGEFVAATQICPHNATKGIRFVEDNGGQFRCDTHGARFDQTGSPQNDITRFDLKIYNTSLEGDILRVFE